MTLLAFALLTACSDVGITPFDEPTPAPAPGAFSGRVCDPESRTWLADATVYTHVMEGSHIVDTRVAYTDRDGAWTLEELPGEQAYDIFVQYGANLYTDQAGAWLAAGEHQRFPDPECLDPLNPSILVVEGYYDGFTDVLDALGLGYDVVAQGDHDGLLEKLGSLDELQTYELVFLEGGMEEAGIIVPGGDIDVSEQILANLQDFVAQGGALFASDWAYDAIEGAFPDRLDFVGDDSQPDAAQLGDYDALKAAVADGQLADWVEADYVALTYSLPVWAPIESADDAVSVHLSGDITYHQGDTVLTLPESPLLVSFTSGEGKVYYSSFRVAPNASTEMLLILQYLLYRL